MAKNKTNPKIQKIVNQQRAAKPQFSGTKVANTANLSDKIKQEKLKQAKIKTSQMKLKARQNAYDRKLKLKRNREQDQRIKSAELRTQASEKRTQEKHLAWKQDRAKKQQKEIKAGREAKAQKRIDAIKAKQQKKVKIVGQSLQAVSDAIGEFKNQLTYRMGKRFFGH